MFNDMLDGLIELAADVSHDEAKADWFDVDEYIDSMPESLLVMKAFIRKVHKEYL